MRRALWPLVGSVALVGSLFLFVFPARTYLDQHRRLAATEQRLQVLSRRNAELSNQVQLLNTDAEIERLARQQYSLVKPGEEAYAILPAPAPPPPQSSHQKQVRPAKSTPPKPGSGPSRPASTSTSNAPAHRASPSLLSRFAFWH